MLSYNEVSTLDRDIFDCCDQKPNPNENGGDCCYEAWLGDLVQVTADWKSANAYASNKELEYNLSVEERDRLKAWFADWEATDENADALCRQLELFILLLQKVCLVTDKTNKAIEILFCMIEDLYNRVDKLKSQYDKLLLCINCLKRPELSPGIGIMKLLEDYGQKLDAVILTRDIMIPQVVVVVELAYGLHINICEEYGLKRVIQYWKDKFKCNQSTNPDSTAYPDASKIVKSSEGYECCCLEPAIHLPIDSDEYYRQLEADYLNSKQNVDGLKKELDSAKEKRDALLACKQSLENAINEVNPANKCK